MVVVVVVGACEAFAASVRGSASLWVTESDWGVGRSLNVLRASAWVCGGVEIGDGPQVHARWD